MEPISEEFVLRAAEVTGERMPGVVSAFVVLLEHSWPKPDVVRSIKLASGERTPVAACRALLLALEIAHTEFPTAMFWWKNGNSEFLGFCPRLAQTSGVRDLDLLGRTDAHPGVTWCRQAALYMRDDREVCSSRVPRFDILERQDRKEDTVWLRTSKVPYYGAEGNGTVGGFDTITAEHAKQIARERSR